MKILVTGAGGFVGHYLARILKERGHDVSAMGIGGGEKLSKLGVNSYEADILDEDRVGEIVKNIRPDAMIHLAAISSVGFSWEHPSKTAQVNVCGTTNVITALAKANDGAVFINIGSSDEYGLTAKTGAPLTEDMPCQPQSPYSISKLAAESLALALGKKYCLRVISTRSFNHFGPYQAKGFAISDFASRIADIEAGRHEPVMRIGNLTSARDFTYVEDIVAAYAALIESPDAVGVYNVCSGRARKISDVLDALLSLSTVKIETEPDENLMRTSDVPLFVGNYDRLKRDTGWEPEHDFESGLAAVMDYWRGK